MAFFHAGNFYPRPPRGGRRRSRMWHSRPQRFLSTPSARRATASCITPAPRFQFLSTPSARRATSARPASYLPEIFLSTPSARRATWTTWACRLVSNISIHALREEGDYTVDKLRDTQRISIHALREEGDEKDMTEMQTYLIFLSTPSARRATDIASMKNTDTQQFLSTPSARRATFIPSIFAWCIPDFYPRPPRGGRPTHSLCDPADDLFLSTPSARRATKPETDIRIDKLISIHALREEGDDRQKRRV